jgi:preprotein translocase subunit SecF
MQRDHHDRLLQPLNKDRPHGAGAFTPVGHHQRHDRIFDRIRENQRQSRGQSSGDGTRINQTLSRTIITGGSVIIVVAMLFFFGGAVIHDFAFTLFVGTLVGTYSSIFIASPILVEWHAADQRRRARRLATA